MTKPAILIAGQFPPPVTGFAYITQEIAHFLDEAGHTITKIDIAAHQKRGGLFYHLRRLGLTLDGIRQIMAIVGSAQRRPLFYTACEGGLGLVYTILLCFTARLLGLKTFIHHHSFAYIDRPAFLMRLLLCTLDPTHATHIFLCDEMARQFNQRYTRRIPSAVITNNAFLAPQESTPPRESPQICIGLLSNLNRDKGLNDFITLIQQAAEQGLKIRGVLAGPAADEEARRDIEQAQLELGARLDYRGALYGEAKHDFYRSIDVFVFPTRYANEAQPTVICEAMSHGVPTLSLNRGCIAGLINGCGAVQARDADFVSFALDWLMRHNSPQSLVQLKLDARRTFIEDRANTQKTALALFDQDYNVR